MTSMPTTNESTSICEEISKAPSMKPSPRVHDSVIGNRKAGSSTSPKQLERQSIRPNELFSPIEASPNSQVDQSMNSRSPQLGNTENLVPNETNDRASRDEEESIALARALMAEEAMAASYAMSMDYLRNNREEFSDEDLAALQAAMDDDEDGIAETSEDQSQEDGGMSYELMLRLGERIGCVKSERWASVASEQISKLETFSFDPQKAEGKDQNDCDVKCLVCQFQYEAKESLRILPCKHAFHTECIDQWLMTKDFCPYCRQAIIKEN